MALLIPNQALVFTPTTKKERKKGKKDGSELFYAAVHTVICHLLVRASGRPSATTTTTFTMQYLEVYQNVVTDLLTGRVVRVFAHDDSVSVIGCQDVSVVTPRDAFSLLRTGEARKRRGTRHHGMVVIPCMPSHSLACACCCTW